MRNCESQRREEAFGDHLHCSRFLSRFLLLGSLEPRACRFAQAASGVKLFVPQPCINEVAGHRHEAMAKDEILSLDLTAVKLHLELGIGLWALGLGCEEPLELRCFIFLFNSSTDPEVQDSVSTRPELGTSRRWRKPMSRLESWKIGRSPT